MKNLTPHPKDHPADYMEMKQFLDKVIHSVDAETDVLRDILKALNRTPPKVDLAKTLLDQSISSLTGVSYKAKADKKRIETH